MIIVLIKITIIIIAIIVMLWEWDKYYNPTIHQKLFIHNSLHNSKNYVKLYLIITSEIYHL